MCGFAQMVFDFWQPVGCHSCPGAGVAHRIKFSDTLILNAEYRIP